MSRPQLCQRQSVLHRRRHGYPRSVNLILPRQTSKAIKTSSLAGIKEKAINYDVVAIDEGQFYPDIVEFCEELADQGVIILVAALDGTFQRKPFGNIINLLPVAEKVTKLTAVCVYCAQEASFTQRVIDSKEIELIGGEEAYKPVCRKCYKIHNSINPESQEMLKENKRTTNNLVKTPTKIK